MAKVSVEQRALNAVALFEQSGRTVSNVTIKGQAITFTLKDDAAPANSLDSLMGMEATHANYK